MNMETQTTVLEGAGCLCKHRPCLRDLPFNLGDEQSLNVNRCAKNILFCKLGSVGCACKSICARFLFDGPVMLAH